MNIKEKIVSNKYILLVLLLISITSLTKKSYATGSEELKHVLGGFIGTTLEERREENPTFAIEYEYKFSQNWGVGATLEHAAGELDFNIFAIPVAYHHQHWKFSVAPGIEQSKHHGSEPLVRVGVEYIFELQNHWEISPKVNVDFVDGHNVLVLGMVISKAF